jgi:hypothetical protein
MTDLTTPASTEKTWYDALNAVHSLLRIAAADDSTMPVQIEVARLTGRLLNWIAEAPDLGELTTEFGLVTPALLGQMMMDQLPVDGVLNVHSKTYWMVVGEHMGPDWIDAHRKVGAFMAKTESFK